MNEKNSRSRKSMYRHVLVRLFLPLLVRVYHRL